MANPLVKYIAAMTWDDYCNKYLTSVYEIVVAPIEELSLLEQIKKNQMQAAYDIYSRWGFRNNKCFKKLWKNDRPTNNACKVILAVRATERRAETCAAQLYPYFIELLEREPNFFKPKLLNKMAYSLWFKELKTSARPEADFKDFSEHVRLELAIFESNELDSKLEFYLKFERVLELRGHWSQVSDGKGSTSTSRSSGVARDFAQSLDLESPTDVQQFHTFVFRRVLFQELSDAISNFDVEKYEW